MKFYDREQELSELKKLLGQSKNRACMAVLTGRRRVGKTSLSLEFIKDRKHLYFFVAKKSEPLLCEEYLREIKRLFSEVPIIGDIRYFKDIFQLLLEISKKESFTVIIDEFQEFFNINPSVYSEIQKLWDLNKGKCRLNVITIGSVYSLMYKIFQNSKEPLFNRADRILMIKPFSIRTMTQILHDYKVKDLKTLFDYYLFTGGSPKYIDLLVENGAFSFDAIVNFIVNSNSPFIHEGKNLLIEEFGKEYGTYFSILELISIGKTGRSEIESILESNVGGYLDRLRFIYRHRSAVETGNFDYIKESIKRDYSTYSGKVLEQFYCDLFAETNQYNRIGAYWEKSNLNEIDLVAINDMKKEIVVAEVKMNKKNLDLGALKQKSKRLIAGFPKYQIKSLILSLDDAKDYIKL